ncbi:MAG: CvpA family protein [Candidatus Promineifilaceae bacterium]
MISLVTTLWIMIGLFAFIDMQRGWTRAVIATAGLILSLFAINQFGPLLFSTLGDFDVPFDDTVWRREILILGGIHLFITFFSYAGPTVAGGRLSGKLAIRDNVQDKLLGLIVGAVNGYLIFGTLISFLEYRLSREGWVPTFPAPYPFSDTIIVRTEQINSISQYLPIPLLTSTPYLLPVLLVIIFLFVLIVML